MTRRFPAAITVPGLVKVKAVTGFCTKGLTARPGGASAQLTATLQPTMRPQSGCTGTFWDLQQGATLLSG